MSPIKLTSGPGQPEIEVQPAPFDSALYWRSEYEDMPDDTWPFIFLTEDAYYEANDHADSDITHEVGGILIGQVRQTLTGAYYVVIEVAMAADHVHHSAVHLTFTSDTIVDLHNRKDDLYPDKQIVGWFHTHPGLSVFLSSYDVFLYTNFFTQPWQVALVIDPRAERAGFFRYPNGNKSQLDPQRYGGFYELAPSGQSVIAWRNFERIGAAPGRR